MADRIINRVVPEPNAVTSEIELTVRRRLIGREEDGTPKMELLVELVYQYEGDRFTKTWSDTGAHGDVIPDGLKTEIRQAVAAALTLAKPEWKF